MSTLASILENKGRTLHTVGGNATVFDAVKKMCTARVGALLVNEVERLAGIVTERDIMTRVLLQRRDPTMTRVASVMTTDLVFVGPETDLDEAMTLMTQRRCRHLPVVQAGSLVGIISMGDLVHWTSRKHEHEIQALTEYVSGVHAG